jgi:exosortase D (VPLPA-CTERM-specific)
VTTIAATKTAPGTPRWPAGNPASAFSYGACCLILFALLFRVTYQQLWFEWGWDDYTYCYFVPAIVLYLLWEKRDSLLAIPAARAWSGLLPLALGLAFYFLGEFGGEYYVIFLGSWLVLIGFIACFAGWGRVRAGAFPLCFLVAMFPFPNFINNNLTLSIKLISSRLGVLVMQTYGLSAYREGNVIDLGFTKLQVVDACSGLRYFFPLIVLALLLSYGFKARLWKRVLLVLSAVPISVVTNGLRIASVGILYKYWGPMVAEGFFHDFSGWFIFMLSLGILLLEMRLLKRLGPDAGGALAEAAATVLPEPAHAAACSPRASLGFPTGQLVVAATLMVAAILVSHNIDLSGKIPASRPFAQFPLQVAGWQGTPEVMEKEFLDALNFDEYSMVDYRDRQGKQVSFYSAYYGNQIKGGAIHSPASCLPGGGWVFQESGLENIALPGAGELRVSRAYMEKNGVRKLTYYWFPQHGRVLTNLFQLKLATFWNALTSRRTDGALVRVITPVYENERLSDAEARLQGFTREISPVLAQFIPK